MGRASRLVNNERYKDAVANSEMRRRTELGLSIHAATAISSKDRFPLEILDETGAPSWFVSAVPSAPHIAGFREWDNFTTNMKKDILHKMSNFKKVSLVKHGSKFSLMLVINTDHPRFSATIINSSRAVAMHLMGYNLKHKKVISFGSPALGNPYARDLVGILMPIEMSLDDMKAAVDDFRALVIEPRLAAPAVTPAMT